MEFKVSEPMCVSWSLRRGSFEELLRKLPPPDIVFVLIIITEPFQCHAAVSYTTRGSVCQSQSIQEAQRVTARELLQRLEQLHDRQVRSLAASQKERDERALGSEPSAAAASSSTAARTTAAAEVPPEPRPIEYTFPYAVEQVVEQA